jgi:membrane protease YdiL (CAAX protease family)
MDRVNIHIMEIWRAIRPSCSLISQMLLYLLLSIVCAIPIALLTGQKVMGIWYILPFTLIYLWIIQKKRYRESLWDLGIRLKNYWGWKLAFGFVGTGLLLFAIKILQWEAGWIAIRPLHFFRESILYCFLGLLLALLLNLGIGLGEELLFRGYCCRYLMKSHSTCIPAVIMSAMLFALFHLQKRPEVYALLHLFLLGIVLAVVFILTKSLWMSIGIHAGWDFWGDGIYYIHLPTGQTSRILSYQHILSGPAEFYAFKLVLDIAMVIVVVAMIAKHRALIFAKMPGKYSQEVTL